MAGISLIDVDLGDAFKSVGPYIVLAGGAFGMYWLYNQVQAQKAQTAAAQAAAAPDEIAAQSSQLAALESLLTNNGTSTGGTASTTGQVTYQAPGAGPTTLSGGTAPGLVLPTGGTTNNGVLTTATGPTTGTSGISQLGASQPGSV